jgi:TrmH family RNA methyltransferase
VTRLAITSSSNRRLKAVRRLDPRDGAVLVEGYRQLRAALDGGARVIEVYAAPDLFLGDDDRRLLALAEGRGARVFELSSSAFGSISGGVRADGLAALVARPATALSRLALAPSPLLLVAEAVERPGNLGTVVRSACAAGADAVLVCDGRTRPFHREAVRGSVGTVFRIELAEASSDAAIAWLRERGVRIVVATPGGARTHREAALGGAVAVVVGNERYGVTARWLDAADETVRIPMAGPADSLNVAVAAGIVLFEAAARRY